MKTAFLDTSIVSECHRQGISPYMLNDFLKIKKLIPVIGIFPNFEIAKNILTNNRNMASKLYSFVLALKPEYSRQRADLYLLEINKLRTGEPVDYLLPDASKSKVLNKISEHSKGRFNFKHETFLRERQAWLNGYRKAWQKEEREIISKNYYQNFTGFIQDYFLILKSDYRNMQWIRELLFITTDNKIILNFNEIETLLNNLISYPALRSLIYVHLYLVFLTETNGVTPSEDRFTDCLISIESSYCTTLVSNDKRFIHTHAKKVNPYIEVITLQELTGPNPFYSF